MFRWQLSRVDAVEAVDIDGDRFGSIRHGSEGKWLDTAYIAELVTNDALVEQVLDQLLLARDELEAGARRKGENCTETLGIWNSCRSSFDRGRDRPRT